MRIESLTLHWFKSYIGDKRFSLIKNHQCHTVSGDVLLPISMKVQMHCEIEKKCAAKAQGKLIRCKRGKSEKIGA
jgi:hypothetical protein